jgi:hypothetical protein
MPFRDLATSAYGTFETCRPTPEMSVVRGGPEADGEQPRYLGPRFSGLRCGSVQKSRDRRTVSVMSVACPRLTRSTVASHFTRALPGGNIRSLTIDAAKTDVAVGGSDPSGTASELACAPADARNEKVVAGLRSRRPMRYALTIFRQWGFHENEQIHCGHFGAYRRNYMLDTRESRV